MLAAAVMAAPGAARADGAFPNGQTVLVPADHPGEIILATNFGLVSTEDGGRAWLWSCEQAANSYGHLYQMGPQHRLYAVAGSKLVFSDDGACDWQTGGGALASQLCEDLFVDPGDATRVLAVGLVTGAGGPAYTVLESDDGGTTFDRAIYTAAAGDLVTGVEIAASDPMVIDVALSHGAAGAATLARSSDGGATWALTDLSAALGPGQVRILAIDPSDAGRVLLRAIGPAGDALAIADGAGPSVFVPLTLAGGSLVAFTRTTAGTLLLAGSPHGAPVLYRSLDAGATFAPVNGAPAVLALAARAGIVYAATDTTLVPFAEATSTDEGASWEPGMAFAGIAAIDPCVKAACQGDCAARATQQQWPAAMCVAGPPTDPLEVVRDGGPPDAVTVSRSIDAAAVGIDAGDVPRPHTPTGCSCAAGPGSSGVWAALLVAAGLVLRRRRPAASGRLG